jgi:hypothetical protein
LRHAASTKVTNNTIMSDFCVLAGHQNILTNLTCYFLSDT